MSPLPELDSQQIGAIVAFILLVIRPVATKLAEKAALSLPGWFDHRWRRSVVWAACIVLALEFMGLVHAPPVLRVALYAAVIAPALDYALGPGPPR